ncbi:MAG: helix-hairpin-helix domain-containing protein [Coriobacteriales bacterium]|jgi:competence protein ComEA
MSGTGRNIDELLQKAQLGKIPPNVLKAIAVVALVVITVALFRWVPIASGQEFQIEQAQSDAVSTSDAEDNAGESATDAVASEQTTVMVHVAGAVGKPGVYELEEGSRVNDAVELAGGLSDDASSSSINLARVLVDGEQIYVPTKEEVESGSVAGATASGSTGDAAQGSSSQAQSLVNINTATAEQLEELPGIGPATAQAIIEYREQSGGFTSIEEIQEVSGIGEGKYSKICELICV